MPTQPCRFVWYELMTNDSVVATAFYRAVVGWDAADAGMPDGPYTLFSVAGTPVAGLMALPAEGRQSGAEPRWIGYVGVPDVDAHLPHLIQAGGAVHRMPTDIPGVGRFAVVADPQGSVFVLFNGLSGSTPQAAAAGWHELRADDAPDFAFYETLFGWSRAEAIDMGPMGLYQTFATGGAPVGGMRTILVTRPADMLGSGWLFYFNVPDIEAAAARVREAGGRVMDGPHPVPGGSWILHCGDPQGAAFALVAPPAG